MAKCCAKGGKAVGSFVAEFSQKPVLAAGRSDAFLTKNRHLGQTRVLMNQVGADACA
ncbi:MAG: hypothetical protein ABFS56_25410 [Pseudomonadota bacterium]